MVVCMFKRLMQKDNFYATVQSKKKRKERRTLKKNNILKDKVK